MSTELIETYTNGRSGNTWHLKSREYVTKGRVLTGICFETTRLRFNYVDVNGVTWCKLEKPN